MLLDKAKVIDNYNVEALIDGFHKNNKIIHQSIYCRPRDLPNIFYLLNDHNDKYTLSSIGNGLKGKKYLLKDPYLVIVDTEYKLQNSKEIIINFWRDACSNDLFDIWDPLGGPVKQMETTGMRTVCLLRIYKINKKFYSYTDFKGHGRHRDFINPIELDDLIIAPVLNSDEFRQIKDKLEMTLKKHNARLYENNIINTLNLSFGNKKIMKYPTPDLEIGIEYTKEEIEEIFHTNFGYGIKGITQRKWNNEIPYLIIFSRASGPYSDEIIGDVLYYDGEGEGKDQDLTPANKALKDSNNNSTIIYGFRQEEKIGKWKYIGILSLEDWSYYEKDGFKKYEYKLRLENIQSEADIQKESEKIISLANNEPELTEEQNIIPTLVNRKTRDAAFQKNIRSIYNNTCVICNKRRFNKIGNPEIDAAHIFPKEKDGKDDLRNGIALCKFHHWAFDNGLFSIGDDLKVLVWDKIKDDISYDEISKYENIELLLPNSQNLRPHPIYLSAHRKIHGFE